MENTNLPTLQDLYNDTAIAKKESKFNVLLNQNPNPKWVHKHPVISNVVYIPIERIEYLLTRIFQVWNAEIKNVQLIANSVVVTVRLHYKNPVTGQMNFHDGVGAQPLQTDKTAGAIEFDKIKSNAVMLAAPAAESYAIKDAAEKLGKLFGKDLNRGDKIGYDALLNQFKDEDEPISPETYEYITSLISNCTHDEDTKCQMERELETLKVSESQMMIDTLLESQKDPMEGNYSQSDFAKTKRV